MFTGDSDLQLQLADGSQPAAKLLSRARRQVSGSWSPDGAEILFVERGDIFVLNVEESEREPVTLLAEDFDEQYPRLSPDGRWLAYGSNESGRFEVYLRAYPSVERKQQVSSQGGYMPVWSADGDELFYLDINPAERGQDRVHERRRHLAAPRRPARAVSGHFRLHLSHDLRCGAGRSIPDDRARRIHANCGLRPHHPQLVQRARTTRSGGRLAYGPGVW